MYSISPFDPRKLYIRSVNAFWFDVKCAKVRGTNHNSRQNYSITFNFSSLFWSIYCCCCYGISSIVDDELFDRFCVCVCMSCVFNRSEYYLQTGWWFVEPINRYIINLHIHFFFFFFFLFRLHQSYDVLCYVVVVIFSSSFISFSTIHHKLSFFFSLVQCPSVFKDQTNLKNHCSQKTNV